MDFSSAQINMFHVAGAALLFSLGLAIFIGIRSSYSQTSLSKRQGLPLPPGPRPLPFVGNILDMPMKKPWETFTKWGNQYGDVVHVKILGQSIVFLNTARAAHDLFEKRSALYSDRPRLPLLNDVMGLNWNFGLMPYGDVWRKHRRLFVSMFGPSNAHVFDPVQEYASARLLERMLMKPDDFLDHIRLHSGQAIIMSAYGLEIESREDRYITVAETVMSAVSDAARPGAWLVDTFPILKKVPAWFPGAFYQRVAKQWANDVRELRESPFEASKERLASERPPMASFVSELIEKHGHEKEIMEETIRDCAAIAYGAGSDTSVSAIAAFVLAMAQHPDVQKKAQAQLDAVVGSSRLPSFADRRELPYIIAIMKETLRWHTVVPQGLPHSLREDDVYNGYFIPAGSVIIGNSWGILHDPAMYPEPMEFKPERYFNAEGKLDFSSIDPSKYAFGYGRRFCAGHTYAENTLYLTMAYILATFDITPAIDDSGKPIPVVLDPTSGVLSHPSPYKCSITPRSEQTRALILQANGH
ncbi:hypothetical protein M0805_001047 [Coniferiporia weirii]|nr:hypothetical protein M0805_001047 [Coniferiporia weirii]